MRAKYRVYLTEYERGWGQRPFSHKDFDSKDDALRYANQENAKNTATTAPDWYVRAEEPILVDLDVVGD